MTITSELIKKGSKIHFVGIGGIGMSALAQVMLKRGYRVSGSDFKKSEITDQLQKNGCDITIGSDIPLSPSHIVIYSSAVSPASRQLKEARQQRIPIFHRSELLSFVMKEKTSIGVTGTHGKTTTSALISFLAQESGLKPTCLIGGVMLNYHTNALIGEDDIVIAEVDESDKSLLNIHPKIAVITNLEEDHLDIYNNLEDIKNTSMEFIHGIDEGGSVVYNYDDENLRCIIERAHKKGISFGREDGATIRAKNIRYEGTRTSFELYAEGYFIGTVITPFSGLHNVYNTLAALTPFFILDINLKKLCSLLLQFKGTERRIEIKYQDNDIVVIDDYAHHPTEIMATLEVLQRMKMPEQKVVVVFEPHRYSRTMHLGEKFGTCFNGVDQVVITNIYGAGEAFIEGVDETIISKAIEREGTPPVVCQDINNVISYLIQKSYKRAIIAFLGAGDITHIANEFSMFLKKETVET
ncbi:MAG: UDP-N-acetylmuramate--L-alanine ligase [Candidatus Omnitrophota bacterium]